MLNEYVRPGVTEMTLALREDTPPHVLALLVDRHTRAHIGPVFLAFGAPALLRNASVPDEAMLRLVRYLFTSELGFDSRLRERTMAACTSVVLDSGWHHAHIVDDELVSVIVMRAALD